MAYYDLKDWERTYHWADGQLQSHSTGHNPGMQLYADDLKTVRMEALFQWADQSKDDVKSADLFLQLAHDPEMKRLHQKAMYNAFVRYHKAKAEIEALDVASQLEKNFPDFESLPEIADVRAALYQEAGDYAHADPLLDEFVLHAGKDTDPEVIRQAKLNLALISEALGKSDKAAKRRESESWTTWSRLEKMRVDFEKKPLPARGELVARIKKGGEALERIAKEFADASTASATPVHFAYESYCALPSLYSSYAQAVLKLADDAPDLKNNERQELKIELSKVTDPIQSKVRTFADQCLARSAESSHDGPRFRDVLERWGWMSDPGLKNRADEILAGLKKNYPWLDQGLDNGLAKSGATESELLILHLKRQGTEESWYELARVRWNENHHALSRLTLVDALTLYPNSGKLLNALAAIDEDSSVFELATQKGSGAAWANLAYLHLRSGRLAQSERALEQGLVKNTFDADSELKKKIQELVKK